MLGFKNALLWRKIRQLLWARCAKRSWAITKFIQVFSVLHMPWTSLHKRHYDCSALWQYSMNEVQYEWSIAVGLSTCTMTSAVHLQVSSRSSVWPVRSQWFWPSGFPYGQPSSHSLVSGRHESLVSPSGTWVLMPTAKRQEHEANG